jgi:hypothetical protein
MLFLMGEWLNSGGGGRFTVLHGGARIFFLWVFNPRKVSDVFLVFFLCLVFSECAGSEMPKFLNKSRINKTILTVQTAVSLIIILQVNKN